MNDRYYGGSDLSDTEVYFDDDFDDDLWDDDQLPPVASNRRNADRPSSVVWDTESDPDDTGDISDYDDAWNDHAYRSAPSGAKQAPRPAVYDSGSDGFQFSGSRSGSSFSLFKVSDSGRRLLSVPALVLLDCVLIGCALLTFALFHHVLPRYGTPVVNQTPTVSRSDFSDFFEPLVMVSDSSVSGSDTETKDDDFPFTDEVIVTDTSYHSPNVAVTVTTYTESRLVYHVQDIYVRSPEFFRTAFAKDTYGVWVTEETPKIASSNNAVCAINGDYYGASSTKGLVIRNGVFYRGNGNDTDDILVLLADGSMEVYTTQTYNEDELLKKNIWQTWSFGPSLLDSSGNAIEHFDSEIASINPRTVVGYYEPGHYCFISVEGRSDKSKGLTLADLATLCQSMGCRIAYNLDGGKTSMMTFGDRLVNDAYHGGRECSDILYICDSSAE